MRDRANFFIIGVQKGGTTALADYLREHPGIQLSRVKEVHHFDDETHVDWAAPTHERLHTHFDWTVRNVVRGEATPIYLYWPSALPRLQRYNPLAKLIVALRHPAFRAFSHWQMERERGEDAASFEWAISEQGRARVQDAAGGVHRIYSYVERGFYAPQLRRLLELFPREQVHFFRTDRLWNDTAVTLAAVEKFLGLAPHFGASVQRRYVTPLKSDKSVTLPRDAKAQLTELFGDDIRRTSDMTSIDLLDWLDPDYLEPMR